MGSAPGLLILVGFLLPVAGVGAIVGWLGGRTREGSTRGVAAGLLFGLGPGHDIPFLAGTPAVGLEVEILDVVLFVASVTFALAARCGTPATHAQSAGEPTR